MVRIGEEREFSGTFVLHWEATRFEWRTGRRRFFGLLEEKVNCQLEFPEGLRTPFFDAFGGTAPADWRARPGLVFNIRFRGIGVLRPSGLVQVADPGPRPHRGARKRLVIAPG